MKQTIKEIIKYGLVGVVGLSIDFGVYYLLVSIFNIHYSFSEQISNLYNSLGIPTKTGTSDALVSSLIGNTLGAVNNFLMNSYFTFKVSDRKFQRFIPYIALVILGMFLSTVFMTIMLDYMHFNKDAAKIIAIMMVSAIQFVLNKLVIFRKKKI
ncbi:MAG: GtrA family protein [Dysgonomonas sp.]